MDLSKIPTCKLVEELAGRDGVKEVFAEPSDSYDILINNKNINTYAEGPALILEVID